MPRRGRRGLAAAAALAAALPLAACGSGASTANCQLTQQVTVAGDALTLLPRARLDRIGARYLLIGADDSAAHWAPWQLASGTIGATRDAPLPAGHAGVWYGAAGDGVADDSVLLAVGTPAANGSDLDITVHRYATGAAGIAAGPPIATIAGGALPGARPLVAMASSRNGRAAGLAWVDPASGAVMLAVLGPDGLPVAPPYAVETAPAFGCLAFASGNAELTLGYYKYLDPRTGFPSWVIAEAHGTGAVESTLTITLESATAGCPVMSATAAGYVLAWQDRVGSWVGIYQAETNRVATTPFAGATTFGGADLQPPLAGVAPVGDGKDFAVVLAKASSAELWRLNAVGARLPGTLGLPSMQGAMGEIAALPVDGALYATYADYAGAGAAVRTAGQRYLIRAACF